MYFNKVSSKDLFSTNPGLSLSRHDSQDVDSGSNSQFPYSQLDLNDSQGSSQLSQSSDSPGRKFYQRYMSKGPLFGREASGTRATQPVAKVSYQQQLQANKARAKERDERDLLNSMLLTMTDCAAEVKDAVSVVKDSVQSGISSTKSTLTDHLTALEKEIRKSNEKLMNTLKLRDDVQQKVAQLELQVAERDARISELEKQLSTAQQQNQENMAKHLQDLHQHQQEKLTQQLADHYADQRRELEKQTDLHKQHLDDIVKHTTTHTKQLDQKHNKNLKQLEKRLDEELEGFGRSCQKDQQKLRYEWEKELDKVHGEHLQEVQTLLQQQFRDAEARHEDTQVKALRQQQKELKDMHQKHKTQLDKCLKEQLKKTGSVQEAKLEALVERMWKEEKEQSATQQKQQQEQLRDEVTQAFNKQLQELRERHEREVASLRAMAASTAANSSCSAEAYGSRGTFMPTASRQMRQEEEDEWREEYARRNVIDPLTLSSPRPSLRSHRAGQHGMFSNPTQATRNPSTGFVSPMSAMAKNWNSKVLFSRTNPSPIATVHPQVQESRCDTGSEANMQQNQPEVPPTRGTAKKPPARGGRKRRGKGRKKGPTKKARLEDNTQADTQNADEISQDETPAEDNTMTLDGCTNGTIRGEMTQTFMTSQRMNNTYNDRYGASRTDVFDFHDEDVNTMVITPIQFTKNKQNFYIQEPAVAQTFQGTVVKGEPRSPNVRDRWERALSIPAPALPSQNRSAVTRPWRTEQITPITISDSENSQDCEEYSSQDSSPSLSITDVFINRRMKKENRPSPTEDTTNVFKTPNIRWTESDDILTLDSPEESPAPFSYPTNHSPEESPAPFSYPTNHSTYSTSVSLRGSKDNCQELNRRTTRASTGTRRKRTY